MKTKHFNQKRGDTLKDLLKKAKFSGTEYSDFVKAMAKEKKNKNKKQAIMRNFIFAFMALMALGMVASCSSKTDGQKEKEQQMADSLRRDSIAQQLRADSMKREEQIADSLRKNSIQKEQRKAELKDKKIAFLKDLYAKVIYPSDRTLFSGACEKYANQFERHLSAKVRKTLAYNFEGIDDGSGIQDDSPAWYVFRNGQQDWDGNGPKRTYIDEGDGWFKVIISGSTPVRINVDSDKDNDENFIITGVKIPSYGITVKP